MTSKTTATSRKSAAGTASRGLGKAVSAGAPRGAPDAAAKAANTQRAIQKRAGQRASAASKTPAEAAPKKKGVQAGARKQPDNPMPAQHLAKPGNEHALDLAPRFLAPDYRGSGKLDGMRAIVTGGDSGIGRAVAVLFAREGADVAIVYLDEHEDAAATVAHIEAEGRRGLAISGDVKDPAFCNGAVREAVKAFGGLEILVNNAAFQQHVEDLEDLADAQIFETLHTNIAGYMFMARAALPYLHERASIINTGSETGLFGSSALLDYSATKGAIHAFTKALASQLLPRGIRVNAVAPGPVWTPLNPADRDADAITRFGRQSDMGRPAQPEEISPAYVFLASPVTGSYVNGVVLPVMGGPTG